MITNYYIMIGKEVQYRVRLLKSSHLKDLFCKQIMVEKNKKTAPEIIRFQGLWSVLTKKMQEQSLVSQGFAGF